MGGLNTSITFTEGEGASYPCLAQGPAKGKTGPADDPDPATGKTVSHIVRSDGRTSEDFTNGVTMIRLLSFQTLSW